jgi:signal transduction histidine kinase
MRLTMRTGSSSSHHRLGLNGQGLPSMAVSVARALGGLAPGPDSAVRRLTDRLRWVPSSLKTRILAWFIGLLAFTTVLLVAVTYMVLALRLDQRIDAELTQEAAELASLADGRDPQTGERFGTRVTRIFDVYFERNVPSRNEALIALVNGRPYRRSRPVVPYQLNRDAELVARWSGVRRTERGQVDTPAGRVDYIAVPLRTNGRTSGTFIAAIFRDRLQGDYDATLRAATAAGLAVLLIGSLLAWRLAGRVVDRVGSLTRTARAISESDLSRRIEVDGRDEVAQLAETFNEMLGRLERAFATQRQFLGDAGHELRTPLTIVSGHLELLPDDPEERREAMALMADELQRMGRLVDDVLLLAKREQPRFLKLSTVEVGALTDELAQKVAALAPGRTDVEQRGRGIVVADRQRLTQAVLQLADNAVRHSGDTTPISLGSSVAGDEARVWIRDLGPGVPLEAQATIFDRFRRGTRGSRSEGSGLGLAIVKVIAEAHGGRVELESAPGEGATFTIVVPVDQPEEGVDT